MKFNRKLDLISRFLILFISSFFLWQCGNKNDKPKITIDTNIIISTSNSKIIKFKGRLFSVPSPLETSELLEETKIPYNKTLLNLASNLTKYNTANKQALNLGVYGTDLGYTNIFEQYTDSPPYLNAVKLLASELSILSLFNQKTLEEIERKQENKDSLIQIIANAYKKADFYLTDSNRDDIAVLILVGGWAESLYLMTSLNKVQKKNTRLIARIAEQKYPLENLVALLRPYYGTRGADFDEILIKLIEIATVYDGVITKNQYLKPEIDAKKKMTIINNKTTFEITDYQLDKISSLATKLRATIIK